MQVPEHLVSFYVATCGQNGAGLGSDEKEIILLVYVILEAATGQIIGTKQILVRPDGSFVKDRTVSTSSDASNNAASPTLAITYSDALNNNNSSTNNNCIITNNNNSIINSPTAAIAATTAILNTNNCLNNINNNINTTTTANALLNGLSTSPPISTTITAAGITATTENSIEYLPIAIAQAAGKPLKEAIEEFDKYLHSLALHDAADIKLITDGQLPLRQCLHREACAKDIELPAYYNRFCDLRKEYVKYKSGDLSRALVPWKDIKKLPQIPTAPAPQNIAEMMNELNITSIEDTQEFYIKESRDMVSVIQHLLKTGHKFMANETVNLVLEPGICSIDDEIDGTCIVRARGLPWQSSDQDIAKFFRGLNVAKGGVALCLSPMGRRNGEALIRFVSQEHRDMALKRHKHHIDNRYIEVYRAGGADFLAIAGGASNEAQAFLSKGAQVIIRMRGLPYDCSAKQVLEFFTTGENPCHVLDNSEGVLFVKKPDGRATGDAFVLFANEADAPKALGRHRESIGQRYIELFRSTTAEVQQVLNRSLDPKNYETNNHQPPLIAQLPQLSLLPQHLITSGTTKNCIRLRGLPYEALVEHILHFLDDFAKHIIYQGVHMVINAQRQPSGEAFIQMDSEESARLCAQHKHNQFMVFGKKYRYIEVFQCSGDDMNMVLNGGMQSPVAAHHPHMPAGNKQPSLLSPGTPVIGAPFGAFPSPFGPTPHPATAAAFLASPHHRAHSHPHPHPAAATHPHHPASFYPQPFVYWSYPSPPVSPTTYFSQTPHTPTHVAAGNLAAAQHQAMFYAAAAQPSPLSPPSIATAGILMSPNKTQPLALVTPTAVPAAHPVAALPTAAIYNNNTTNSHKMTMPNQTINANSIYQYNAAATAPAPTPLIANNAAATAAATTFSTVTVEEVNDEEENLHSDSTHFNGNGNCNGSSSGSESATEDITNVHSADIKANKNVVTTTTHCTELYIS